MLLAIAGTVAYVVIKLGVFDPSLSEQIATIEKADGSWWLGKQFEGLPITLANPASGDRVDDIGYGKCQRFGSKLSPFASTRCGYPLLLQVNTRRYDLSLDDVPTRLDGTCARTTIRGAPVVVGPTGSVLYTGDLAIAALGRPEQVGRALSSVRLVNGATRLAPPSPAVDALDSCVKVTHPFTPLATRIAALRKRPRVAARLGRPLVRGWTADRGRENGKDGRPHLHELRQRLAPRPRASRRSRSRAQLVTDPRLIHSTLAGATCRTFTVAGAPGVAWTKDLAGETGAGVVRLHRQGSDLPRQRHHARGDPDLAGRGGLEARAPAPARQEPASADLRHAPAARCLRRTRARRVARPDAPHEATSSLPPTRQRGPRRPRA